MSAEFVPISNPFSHPSPRTVKIAVFAAVVLFLLMAQRSFVYVPDDAFITYRYARNLAEGHGPVFNIGAHVSDRAEGYSCPLFMLLMAFLLKLPLGLDVLLRARFFGILCGLAVVVLAPKLAARMGLPVWAQGASAVLLAAHAGISIQSVDGMETVLQALLLLLAAWGFLAAFDTATEKSGKWTPLLAGLAFAGCALNRPEGVLMGLFALAMLIAVRGRHWRGAETAFALAFLLPTLSWFLFRHAFYGLWLPNTYYAKSAPLETAIFKGATYLLRTFFYFLNDDPAQPVIGIRSLLGVAWWLLVFVGMSAERSRRFPALIITLMSAGQAVFVLRSGGDWMGGWRYMTAALPLLMLLALTGIAEISGLLAARPAGRKAAGAMAGGLTALVLASCLFGQWSFWSEGARDSYVSWADKGFSFRQRDLLLGWKLERAMLIGDWLNTHLPPGSVVAYSEMGVTPYLAPRIRFLDVDGLTDHGVAVLPGAIHGQIGVDDDYLSPNGAVGPYLRDVRRPDYLLRGGSQEPVPVALDSTYTLFASFPAPAFPDASASPNEKLPMTAIIGVWKRRE